MPAVGYGPWVFSTSTAAIQPINGVSRLLLGGATDDTVNTLQVTGGVTATSINVNANANTLNADGSARLGNEGLAITSLGGISVVNPGGGFVMIVDPLAATVDFNNGAVTISPSGATAIASLSIASQAADLSLNSHKLTNVTDPLSAQDAATKSYVDAAAQGLDPKASCLVASTANLTLSGEQTIDGFLTSASRVLVKNQSTGSQNGIYVSAAGAWARSADANAATNLTTGAYTFIEKGTVNGGTGWVLTTPEPIIIGTTALMFTQFSGAGTYTAGSGLQLTGTQFFVPASGITNAMLAGSIAAAKLIGTDIATVGTLTAGATGPGFTVALATSTVTGVLTEVHGGTNQSTYATGDTLYASGANTLAKLAANATATKKYLQSVSSGVPSWQQVAYADISGTPSLAGYVPYTGASGAVNLNTQALTAGTANFASSAVVVNGTGVQPLVVNNIWDGSTYDSQHVVASTVINISNVSGGPYAVTIGFDTDLSIPIISGTQGTGSFPIGARCGMWLVDSQDDAFQATLNFFDKTGGNQSIIGGGVGGAITGVTGPDLVYQAASGNHYFQTINCDNINDSGLTASRAVATDSSKNLVSSATTDTELGYVSGVTSAIQTQLNSKLASGPAAYAHTIFTPTTGQTVALVVNQYNIINPSGALLALTVNLPSTPSNGDVVYIKFTQTITTVTYGNGTVVDGITAPSAGGLTVLVYDTGTTKWY